MGTGSYFMSEEEIARRLEFYRQLNAINRSNEREEMMRKKYGMAEYSSFDEYINDVDYNPYTVISDDWGEW